MIDHYEDLFTVPPEVMDDVFAMIMDTYPENLDQLFDRCDLYVLRF